MSEGNVTVPQESDLQVIATRLLDFFGMDGKRWAKHHLSSFYNHRGEQELSYCLMGGCRELNLNAIELHQAVVKSDSWTSIPDFNDKNDWETVKGFLLKLAHPYQPKELPK